MNDDIREILKAGTYAPSGENAQPWKFLLKDNTIEIYNLPDRDKSLYSWGQRASYMANGAALENITIAASQFGYISNVELFPDKANDNFIARIGLKKAEVSSTDHLYPFIYERTTNRKPYDTKGLTKNEEKELLESIIGKELKLHFTQDHQHKEILGGVGSANEVIMLSNRHLHNFFFNHINWTKDEDDQKKIGFFIDTLELQPPAKIGFKIMRFWHLAKIFNKVGMHKMVGKQNAKINSAAAGFGVITIPDNSPQSYVKAGRALQRMWLTATKLNLSLQPLTGILFFMSKVLANDTEKFTKKHVEIIKNAYRDVQTTFNVNNNEIIAFMFRIGHGGKPTARSSRFTVDEVTEIL